MSRNVAISIGVQRSGDLTELPGAAAGAAAFAAWARSAGFVVHEFTDAGGDPVVASEIFDAITSEVEKMDVDRLVLYFGGHGVSKGTAVDYWLLSKAPKNPNEVVDVASSIRNARRCGVPHIVIIADACRTMAGKNEMGVGGYVLFADNQAPDAEVDQFFGAASGDPAYEVANDAQRRAAYGIFSDCVMEALRGEAAAATEPVDGGQAPRAVTGWALRDYLVAEVPVRAGRRGLKQYPSCLPGSRWPPNVVAWVQGGATVAGGGGDDGMRSEDGGVLEPYDFYPEPSGADMPPPSANALEDENVKTAAAELAAEVGRGHFETASGLTVIGATPVAVAGGDSDLFEEDGLWHVRGPGSPGSVILDLGDDRYVATALLPEFLGTVHVGRSGVDLVTYQGAPGTMYAGETTTTVEALALLGAAMRVGFHDMGIDEVVEIGRVFRREKHRNPTYGVIAAYAYERAGRTDEIRDMIHYFVDMNQTVPFDLPLLGFVAPDEIAWSCAPAFPLMTQGWAYLDPNTAHPAVAEARESLAPSVWATPTGSGGKALFQAVEKGELR